MDNRHTRLHEIRPRHYRQTVVRAGVSVELVDRALDQVVDTLPGAIDTICAALPPAFPAALRDSIASAALKRREVIAAA